MSANDGDAVALVCIGVLRRRIWFARIAFVTVPSPRWPQPAAFQPAAPSRRPDLACDSACPHGASSPEPSQPAAGRGALARARPLLLPPPVVAVAMAPAVVVSSTLLTALVRMTKRGGG